jgi:hypothetical protein
MNTEENLSKPPAGYDPATCGLQNGMENHRGFAAPPRNSIAVGGLPEKQANADNPHASLKDANNSLSRVSHDNRRDNPLIEWRLCGAHPQYEVSNTGQVRHRITGYIKKQRPDTKGYLVVTVAADNKARRKPVRVHNLVAPAFLGPCPPGMQPDHLDTNKLNNHATNFEYVTSGENTRRAFRAGLIHRPKGDAHYRAKLDADKVRAIKRRLPSETDSEIAKDYGVNQATIWQIRKGNTWSHVA